MDSEAHGFVRSNQAKVRKIANYCENQLSFDQFEPYQVLNANSHGYPDRNPMYESVGFV